MRALYAVSFDRAGSLIIGLNELNAASNFISLVQHKVGRVSSCSSSLFILVRTFHVVWTNLLEWVFLSLPCLC